MDWRQYFPWKIAAKYHQDQGSLFGSYHDVEKGVVFATGVGTPIRIPIEGVYDANDSTPYQSVFTLDNGEALNVMHINATRFGDGQLIPAGSVIGDATQMYGGPYYGFTPQGLRHSYYNTRGVVEVGVFDTPAHAFARDSGGDVDPLAALSAMNATPLPGTPPSGGLPTTPIGVTGPGDPTIPPLLPGQPDPNPHDPLPGQPGSIFDPSHFGTGLGQDLATLSRGLTSQFARFGLVALFAVAALAILILVLMRASGTSPADVAKVAAL